MDSRREFRLQWKREIHDDPHVVLESRREAAPASFSFLEHTRKRNSSHDSSYASKSSQSVELWRINMEFKDFLAMDNHYSLRTPAEPMPPPVKEPPPDGPENPDVPVREPDPEEPGQI